MALSLGLDIGTQGAKAVVYDTTSRRIVGRGAAAYDIIKSDVPGRAEQAPSTWLAAGTAAARQALSGLPAGKVAAVGVSGQQHGFVPLDRSGRVLRNAKLWCACWDTATGLPSSCNCSMTCSKDLPLVCNACGPLCQATDIKACGLRTFLQRHDKQMPYT